MRSLAETWATVEQTRYSGFFHAPRSLKGHPHAPAILKVHTCFPYRHPPFTTQFSLVTPLRRARELLATPPLACRYSLATPPRLTQELS